MGSCNTTGSRGGCGGSDYRETKIDTFDDVVKAYKDRYVEDSLGEVEWFGPDCPSLEEAISRAVNSKVRDGIHHSHQNKIGKSVYPESIKSLISLLPYFEKAKNFHEIFNLVNLGLKHINGAGELLIYDVADRIGCYLNLRPEQVYLHRGTRDGARNLGLNVNRVSIPISEFKRKFKDLTAAQIEDVLCIYKNDMVALRSLF